MRSRPKMDDEVCASQMTLRSTCVPASISLNGIDPDAGQRRPPPRRSCVWSPIAAFSPMRAWARMSHMRPTTAPSTIALEPTYVEASTIERATRACSRSATLCASTE